MRRMPGLLLAVVLAGCGRSQPSPPPGATAAPQECTYEIVHPDKSPAATAFLAWLKPRADELVDGGEPENNGDVFIADLDNDGKDEILFAKHEGSSSFLFAFVFRGTTGNWKLVDHLPFDDQLELAHDYMGPLMNEPQFVARFCGKTILNFQGGTEPNYYPVGVLWEGNTAKPICTTPWLAHHRHAAADLVNRNMLDEARVLLDGVQRGCDTESPAEVRAIKDDIARIDASTAKITATSYDFSWLIAAAKKDPEQQLVLDARFGAMLTTIVPDAQLEHESLRGGVKKSVWLPQAAKVIDDRYVLLSGCEPHNCGNRGLIWIDTVAKQAVVMTNGTLASKTTEASRIPAVFWKHTLDTVGAWTDEKVDFIGPSGITTGVKAP